MGTNLYLKHEPEFQKKYGPKQMINDARRMARKREMGFITVRYLFIFRLDLSKHSTYVYMSIWQRMFLEHCIIFIIIIGAILGYPLVFH